jgi:hypothetical protein
MKRFFLVASILFSAPTLADYYHNYNLYYAPAAIANHTLISNQGFQNIKNQAQSRLAELQSGSAKSNSPAVQSATRVGSTSGAPVSMRYTPSIAVTDKVNALMIADVSKQTGLSPEQIKAKIAAARNIDTPPKMVNRFLQKQGLPENDLTSSLTLFFAIANVVLGGKEVTKPQIVSMSDKLGRSFGTATAFGSLGNDQKQTFAEYLAWMSQLMYLQSLSNPVAAKKSTLKLLGEFGFDQAALERLMRV